MPKDSRYDTLKKAVASGHLEMFNDIFKYLPKSVIQKELGFNNDRINKLMADVSLFKAKDLFRLADALQIPYIDLMTLVCNQHVDNKKNVKSKKK